MEQQNPDRTCQHCGTPLTDETTGGLCPRCLLEMNFASRTMPGGEPSPQLPPPSPEEMAARFPQFEILECLGRGGMGIVYKARQKTLDRLVAIKVLAGERSDDPQFEARFSREARTLAKLSHPNIVTVHDFGESDGMFYLVMEFVDGVNLRDVLRDGRLEAAQALAIVPEICAALQFAHDHGVIHRDIKPENILLDRDGRVKIADFGIASLVGAAADRSGTPPYMAPEQEQLKGNIDHRADIYALGVVFYEMLTGERPDKNLVAPSRKVEIDVRIDELVLRALEKEPERRYQTAGEFRTVVQTILTTPPQARPRGDWRTRVAVVGVRDGKRMINWPAVVLDAVALTAVFALAILAGTANSDHPFQPLPFLLVWLALLSAIPLGIRWGLKHQPAERLLPLPVYAKTHGFSRSAAISGAILGAICGAMVAIYIGILPSHSPWWQKLLLSLLISSLVAGVFVLGAWLAAKTRPQPGTPPAPTDDRTTGATQPSRFSRTAIVGACWAALFVVMVLFSFLGHAVLGQYLPLKLLLLLVGTTAPFATTILGCVAVSQIRRSAGRLHGLGLALFDAVLFPLLTLDVLIGFFWSWIVYDLIRASIITAGSPVSALTALFVRHASEIVMLFTVPVALVLDYFLIRRAWRAVRMPVGGNAQVPANGGPSTPKATEPGASKALRPALLTVAWHAALLLGTFGFFVVVTPGFQLMFNDYGTELPVLTVLTLTLGQTISRGGFLLLPVLLALDAGICILTQHLAGRWLRRVWSAFVACGCGAIVLMAGVSLYLPTLSLRVALTGTPAAVTTDALGFGPVIERVVTKEIDLDSGSLNPEALKGSHHRADAIYEDPVFVFSASTLRIQLTVNDWDGLSAEQLQTALNKRLNISDATFNKNATRLPITLGFRTDSGRMGILQIIGFNDVARGPKIRYKLVQDGSATSPR